LLKGKRESTFPSQLMNPENKSETFTKGKDINLVMCNHFNSFGKESSIDLKLKKKIEDFISNVNNNEVSSLVGRGKCFHACLLTNSKNPLLYL
jgi:hypothetical protein